MPSNSSLPDFEKYYLPSFPEAGLLETENDFDGIKGFGRITIKHPIPEYYYYFGSLTEDYIANKAFVRTNLVVSAGLVFANSIDVWSEVTTGNSTPVDMSKVSTNSLGNIAKNKIIPICLDIVDSVTSMSGFDFEFCPPPTNHPFFGGGNGICTKVLGQLLQVGEIGFDRIIFFLKKSNIPKARGLNEEPSKRLSDLSKVSSNDLDSGYFFMPMLCPDLSILYYFYPNAQGVDVKKKVNSWLSLDKTTVISVKKFEVHPFEELHTFLTEEITH
ncbi:hypothetical protein [Lewinella sp. LCG006]|uniref:hypothetical protein n=1 Tax=Lewinella sp. LCG006 TaxID=3231911 RepID=UPI00345FA865